MVESEFGAMSAAIGASADGARSYTATASQGLLYMAEALYNASGLGLPIVMTVANRAIGAPINIWNDHSRRDVAARLRLDPALRRVEPGGGRPPHPGVQARGGAVAAGHGLHGRLRPHPCDRGGRAPDAGAGRRLSAAVPPAAGPRPGRPGDDRRDGRARGVRRGQVPHAREADAGPRPPPRDLGGFSQAFGRSSGGLVRAYRSADAETIVVALGSVLGTIEEVVDELRADGVRIGALGITCFRPYPLEEIRAALAERREGRRPREGVRRRPRRHRRAERETRAVGSRRPRLRRGRGARRPADHPAVAPHARRATSSRTGSSRTGSSSSTSTGSSSSASCDASRPTAAPARMRRTSCATSASVAASAHGGPPR